MTDTYLILTDGHPSQVCNPPSPAVQAGKPLLTYVLTWAAISTQIPHQQRAGCRRRMMRPRNLLEKRS